MKKIIWIVICALLINSCFKEEEEVLSLTESIVGEWVYDAPEEGRWEILKFTSSGVFFYSTSDISWRVKVNDNGGRYTLDGSNIFGTYKIEGVSMNLNISVSQISDYSFTARFNDIGLNFTYAKLLDRKQIKPNESIIPDYANIVHSNILGFVSHKPKIASVDSNTGEITGVSSGRTYIDVITDEGTAVIEVITFNPNDMFEDYSFALGQTIPEVILTFGDDYIFRDDKNGLVYLSDNYVVDTVKFVTGVYDEDHVEFVLMKVNDNVSKTEILNCLKQKYEIISENGVVHNFSLNKYVENQLVVIVYDESKSMVYYSFIKVFDLWMDMNYLFGKDKATIQAEMTYYGYDFYASDYSYSVDGSDYYIINDNEYAVMVGFVFNAEQKMSEYWIYLIEDFNRSVVLDALLNKYNLAGDESSIGRYVFYDSEQRQRIVYHLDGTVTYTDSQQSEFVPAEKEAWPDLILGFGLTHDQIISVFGDKPYLDLEDRIFYSINNEYIGLFVFFFDEKNHSVYGAAAAVNDNVDKTTIVDYLNSIYTLFSYDTTDGMSYVWINAPDLTSATVEIVYDLTQNVIYYYLI